MATYHKCDKCDKVINRNELIKMRLNTANYIFCNECSLVMSSIVSNFLKDDEVKTNGKYRRI